MSKTITIWHETATWSDAYVAKLTPMFPALRFQAAHSEQAAMQLAPSTHAIIGIGPKMSAELIGAMPQLEWIQTVTTGVENFRHMTTLPSEVVITRVSGVQGPQVSETAIMLMLALARRLPTMLAAQAEQRWQRDMQSALFGKTLCILGLGSIAETLAQYAATMGMRVIGVSDGRTEAPNFTQIVPRSALAQAAGQADFLVVLVPLSDATHHIINADVLAAMKPSAFLINVARGGCVDEAALIDALTKGQIAGAGLDVFAQEPLSVDAPIWRAPNTIVTPHIAGFADVFAEQSLPTIISNLTLYAAHGAKALDSVLTDRSLEGTPA